METLIRMFLDAAASGILLDSTPPRRMRFLLFCFVSFLFFAAGMHASHLARNPDAVFAPGTRRCVVARLRLCNQTREKFGDDFSLLSCTGV